MGLLQNNKNVGIKAQVSPSIDAFARWRVSNPTTLFDSKQLFDKAPLFWNDSLESGAGITAPHSVDKAATTITSTLNTAGKFTRQTFMRFNYQPGKSMQIIMTGILDNSGGGTGVQRRIGFFDDENGIFIEDDEGTIKLVIRSKASGAVVDTKVSQANWDDPVDGTGPSGQTVDWTKLQLFFFDFEWLGTGPVRFNLVLNGELFTIHTVNHENLNTTVYMSTPNLPLRFQMITTDSSPASSLVHLCSSVTSEGGKDNNGVLRYKSTQGAHVDVAVENTIYAIVGIRLKSTHLDASVNIVDISLAEHQGTKEYEWILIFNPTVASTFAYADQANSAVQAATGATANTVTNGTVITGGFASSAQKGGTSVAEAVENALRLGSNIAGTVDEVVLCVRPVGGTSNLDIEGSITWRELT